MQNQTCITCPCGAKYERGEVNLPIKDIGAFECHGCGAVLERWYGRLVPTFKLLALPKAKASSAA